MRMRISTQNAGARRVRAVFLRQLLLREATKGGGGGNGMQDNFENLLDATTAEWDDPTVKHLPFWDVIKEMSARGAMYDVKMMPDGEFRRTTSPPSSLRPIGCSSRRTAA